MQNNRRVLWRLKEDKEANEKKEFSLSSFTSLPSFNYRNTEGAFLNIEQTINEF